MVSTPLFALQLLITTQTISAHPLSQRHKQGKRTTANQNVGSKLAIAICIVLVAVIFYYFGMHHERTKSWLGQRSACTTNEPILDDKTCPGEQRSKPRISCPVAVLSSAPIKPDYSPVEAPTPSLHCFELPIKEVHEMGLPSPKKAPPRASWLSFDRKPWWSKHPEVEGQARSARTSRTKSMRSWFKNDGGMSKSQEASIPSPGLVETADIRACSNDAEQESKSDGSTLMDWSGLDYVRKIYIGRKSRVEL